MSRTVYYDTNGNEIYEEDFDTTTYPQEQLEYLKEKEELMKTKKEKQLVEKYEAVNHPAYYKTGGIEAIDVIEAWNLGFCLGNTVKYIARCGKKSDKVVEDLKKAAWYLDREIDRLEKGRMQ